MSRFLDLDSWDRRAAFELFRHYDNPYFHVCAPIDATALVRLTREDRSISFSLACLYIAVRVANEYEPFRYRLQNGRVLVHDRLHVGTTTLVGEERLDFLYWDYAEEFATFRANAERARASIGDTSVMIDPKNERSDLIHFTTVPWLAFTALAHPRNWRREDSVPKITFGRYFAESDRVRMPLSVEVHHALMDGVHVARYFERIQSCFDAAVATIRSTVAPSMDR